MNRFRRITLGALAALAAGIGLTAYAQHRMQGPMSAAEMDQHVERMLKHLYVEIDASEEQKRRLEPILRQAAKDLLPLRDRLHAGRGEAIQLLTQERVDPAAIEALRARQLRLADEASRRLTHAIAEAAEVLTPAQRKGLAARFERHHRRWGHG